MAKIGKVQGISITDLKPYEKNAKIHGDDQVQKIADSITEFGFLNPCIIDKDKNIIAGHGRVMAAKKLGMTKVPCLFVEGLTEAQRRAYILADNRLTELGEWDMNIVGNELAVLDGMGFNIDLAGFDYEQINPDDFGEDFSLPDGEKGDLVQMTFTLHTNQKELIDYALNTVKDSIVETFGNTNSNGNAIYEVARQWAEQRK